MTTAMPGPWVDYSTPDPVPWTDNRGVVKFIEFPVRIPAMSRRAFHLYWLKHHSPHVMNVTSFSQFMRKYSTGHVYPEPVPGLPPHYRQDTPFEGAAEVWINSLDEVASWLGHPLYAELIGPDEPRFIAQNGSVEVILAREERLYDPEPDLHEQGLTKLYLLLKGRNDLGHDDIHAAISGLARNFLMHDSMRTLLRKLVVSHRLRPPAIEGLAMAEIDAVVELWFGDLDALTRFFADPAYTAIQRLEARAVDVASIRAVVGRMNVVHDEFSFQPSTTQPMGFSGYP